MVDRLGNLERNRVEKALRDEFAAWIKGHPNVSLFDWQVATENVLRAAKQSGAVEENERLREGAVRLLMAAGASLGFAQRAVDALTDPGGQSDISPASPRQRLGSNREET